ncbi:MAG: carotenoid oxygenase family protein [Saprospiraceae bacterium]|nr:carotenoid oxygenase family protein [Saprospiraceae bacterium]
MQILDAYLRANRMVEKEFQRAVLPVEGHIPEEIAGALYRNGNGRFAHQGVVYNHLFDGDGMISAFYFQDGQVRYSNRYVHTAEFDAEEQAGRMLYRSFGTNIPGGFLKNALRVRFKNAANTSVRVHAGKLLALWEGGLPHEIDPETLETKSRFHYNGALLNPYSFFDRRIFPELPFSAHPKIHPASGDLYNFGTLPGISQRLMIYRVEANGTAHIHKAVPMPGVIFTHDFILTEQLNMLFFLTPVRFELWKAFLGMSTPVDSIRVNRDKPTSVLLIAGDAVERYETDFGFIFHYANGFDADNGNVVVDALTMPDFPDAGVINNRGGALEAPAGKLTRYTINRQDRTVQKEILSECPMELPYIHQDFVGRPYRYLWSIGDPAGIRRPLLHSVLKTDVQTGQTIVKDLYPMLPGEPVLIPGKNSQAEDDGWIVYMAFHPEKEETTLHVCLASTLEQIAVARLPHNTPVGFHGTWAAADVLGRC